MKDWNNPNMDEGMHRLKLTLVFLTAFSISSLLWIGIILILKAILK